MAQAQLAESTIPALREACQVRTKYELDHPSDCFCKLDLQRLIPPPPQKKLAAVKKLTAPPQAVKAAQPKKSQRTVPLSQAIVMQSPRKSLAPSSPTAHTAMSAPTVVSAAATRPAPTTVVAGGGGGGGGGSVASGTSGVACAAMCEVVGDHAHQGLLQQRSCFTVIVRDVNGHHVRRGSDKVRASSRGPGPLRPVVSDEGDGSYKISYLATISGVYSLAVSCNSAPINRSPLTITVEPSVAHAPSCVAEGDGLCVAVAGDAASFIIKAFDEFGRPKIMGGETFVAFITQRQQPPSALKVRSTVTGVTPCSGYSGYIVKARSRCARCLRRLLLLPLACSGYHCYCRRAISTLSRYLPLPTVTYLKGGRPRRSRCILLPAAAYLTGCRSRRSRRARRRARDGYGSGQR